MAVIGIRDGKQISYMDLQSIKIPFPTLNEQSAIAKILSAADKEIELLKNKISQLKLQKQGLMQKLLTGKIRLRI
jgi:type I restriction enzyme S subunit